MITFIQACGLYSHDHGGSPKVFQSLLDTDHPPVLSINTHFSATPVAAGRAEIQIPSRPDFGRLEHTRLSGSLGVFDSLFSRRFEARLRRALMDHQIRIIHLLATTYSLVPVYNVATELGIPYFVSIHDDLEYVSKNHLLMRRMREFMGKAWRGARGAFVISDEIGQEYSRRYGQRQYSVVTDGLKCIADAPRPSPEKTLRLYFMGLFHNSYAQNLRAVLDALKIIRAKNANWSISVTCRSGGLSCRIDDDDVPVKITQFTPDVRDAEREMLSSSMLYLPMAFQEQAKAFSRFSLSTKMISYLGSGLPIFYHGPEDSAAGKLLMQRGAATICSTLEVEKIARQLMETAAQRESIIDHALALARKQFMLVDQQRKFWEPIKASL